jgi:hypothetical protein
MAISLSGSLELTGSLTVTGGINMSGSIASSSYASNTELLDGRDSLTFANTGSNSFVGSQNINGTVAITGSLTTTGAITAQSINVQQVTSSVVYSSGSNVFGNNLSNTQVMTGSVDISGSLSVNGTTDLTGVLTGTTAAFSGLLTAGAVTSGGIINSSVAYGFKNESSSDIDLGYRIKRTGANAVDFYMYTPNGTTGVSIVGAPITFGSALTGTSATFSGDVNMSGGGNIILNNGSYVGFKSSGGSLNSSIFVNGSDVWNLYHASDYRYTIDSSGNHDFKTGTVLLGGALSGTSATFSTSSNYLNLAATSTTGYSAYMYSTSTVAGYIGNGSSLLSGASNSDFIIRSEGALKFLTNGTNLRLTITLGGNVGIGTESPTQLLQVGGNSGAIAIGDGLTSNGTSRLKFTSSNSVTNWQISNNDSIAGAFEIMPSTVAGGKTFTTPVFYIASTGAATFSSSATATSFIPSGATVPTNGMYLSAANTLNFATNSTNRLSISSGGAATFSGDISARSGIIDSRVFKIYEASAARGGLYPYNLVLGSGTDYSLGIFSEGEIFMASGGSSTKKLVMTSGGEVYIAGTTDQGAYNLQCNGTGVWGAGAYVNGSDLRLKEDIKPILSGLDYVNKMNPVSFKYLESYSRDRSIQTGFIAQELKEVFKDEEWVEGIVQKGTNHYNVAYQNIIPILVKSIQELTARIIQLENK